MSWVNIVGAFLGAAADGFVRELNRPSSVPSESGPSREDFHRYMRGLSEETGFPIKTVKQNHVIFLVPAHTGETYYVMAFLNGGKVTLNAMSNIAFPRNQIPATARDAMRHMNKKLARAAFDVVSTDDHSVCNLMVEVDVSELTPSVFLDSVAELTGIMSALDRMLRDRGYDAVNG